MFFDAGAKYPERCFLASNRTSKTVSGALEMAAHLTGLYPDWWEGRRFSRPVRAWACGETGVTTRDTVQKALLGEMGRFGTGMIPEDCIVQKWAKPGVPNAIETVEVKHTSGQTSILTFRSYDQGVEAFFGVEKEVCWLDECPNSAIIYNECLLRTMTTGGIIYITFTPLKGVTEFIINFDKYAEHLGDSKRLVALSDDEHHEVEGLVRKTKALIQATWADAPWLTEEAKLQMLQDTAPHLKEARSKGIPTIGSGNVYPINITSITVDGFQIPDHYKRLYGMDVGWKTTATVMGALDPDTDILYLYDEYYGSMLEPSIHSERIKAKIKPWMMGMIDPAAGGSSQVDGQKLRNIYSTLGLNLKKADNAVEAGIAAVWDRASTGRLKVFNTLTNFKREWVLYSRDVEGRLIKENDHIMDSLKYLVMGIKYARSTLNAPNSPHGFGGYGGREYAY